MEKWPKLSINYLKLIIFKIQTLHFSKNLRASIRKLFYNMVSNLWKSRLQVDFWDLIFKTVFHIELVGELEPSENWDHLFREFGPPCFSLKRCHLPEKVVPISQMGKFCRTIGTTLLDNWKHLVIQMKTLESRVKSQESKVKSQDSRVKS